jgi:hypothetical protein
VPDLPHIPGFRVIEELGSGSVSSVYKAVEDPLGRTVALKILRPTIDPTSAFAAQLEREARVLSALCHPNIGLLFGFAKDDSTMVLVLEYVDGYSLATLLKKKPTLPYASVAAIGAAVARGLAHAHERGVIHRSLKPASILVSRQGDVKVFDFGIAHSSRQESAGLSPVRVEDIAAFATPAYMSPEQILGENVDARSDVFSLGVILYQLLSGARPFDRRDETDRPTAHRIRRDPAIPLRRRAPDVPAALERIVLRAIEKLPADRVPSAEALAEALEAFLSERSAQRSDRLVVGALAHAALAPATIAEARKKPKRRVRAWAKWPAVGLALLGIAAVGSGALLHASLRREGRSAGARRLELAPAAPGYLRVLATPWAEVWVDGERVEVTPFARPIVLLPGTHSVALVHPNAPVEKRPVLVATGETRTLDVVMAVGEPQSGADAGTPGPGTLGEL